MNGGHDQSVPKLMKSQKKSHGKGKRKSSNDSLKVVYISSPMKVKTSSSRFRSLVQKLTGKNSDISEYMDESNMTGTLNLHEFCCDDDGLLSKEVSGQHQGFSSISSEDTTTSSDTFMCSMDNMFSSQMEEQFAGIFSSSSFCDPSQLDVLGSYDELL